MNGFKQIKSFYSWVFNTDDNVRQSHISLYMFLINQNNRSNWVEWFKCPYDLAMAGACIGSRSTYYNCLADLEKWKLLKYKKGVNNFKAPQIKLIQLYNNEQVPGQVTVPLSEHVTGQLSEQLPEHIYKLITSNLELVTNNLEEWIKKSKKPAANKNPHHSKLKSFFLEFYKKEINQDFYWTVKDATAINQITNKIKKKLAEKEMPETEESILKSFEVLLGYCREDNFMITNLSVALVNSKFNEIINKASNGQGKQTGGKVVTDDELLAAIRNR